MSEYAEAVLSPVISASNALLAATRDIKVTVSDALVNFDHPVDNAY